MSRRKKTLRTLQAVIDELDGVSGMARLTETFPSTICYWRDKRKTIPTKYAPFLKRELARRGFSVDDSLFDFFGINDTDHHDENVRAA
jgi:hypothetical protein